VGAEPAAAEARAGKRAEIMATLERGLDAALSDAGFAAYLRAMARFHAYSFGNIALITAQRPDATLVAGFWRWKALDRHVRRGEQGIWIMVPYKRRVEDEITGEEGFVVTGFGLGTVFDVAQTEGKPLPAPPLQQELGATTVGRTLDLRLSRFLIDEGVRLEKRRTHPARGLYRPATRPGEVPTIALNELLPDDDIAAKTLCQEAAHYVADHRGAIPRADAETVAESAAFVVMSHFGIDTGGYSFPYLAQWARDRAVLKRNLGEIQRVATTLITAIGGQALVPEEAL
jgi:hypothetical protein